MAEILEAMPLLQVGWPVVLGTIGGRLAATHDSAAEVPSSRHLTLPILTIAPPAVIVGAVQTHPRTHGKIWKMVESAWKAEFIGMVVMIACTFSPGKWWGANERYERTTDMPLDAAAIRATTIDVMEENRITTAVATATAVAVAAPTAAMALLHCTALPPNITSTASTTRPHDPWWGLLQHVAA